MFNIKQTDNVFFFRNNIRIKKQLPKPLKLNDTQKTFFIICLSFFLTISYEDNIELDI